MRSVPALRRRLARAFGALMVLVSVAGLAFLAWSRTGTMDAEPGPWRHVLEDPRIVTSRTEESLVLRPSEAPAAGTGLLFHPGAKVAPEAYASRLSGLVTELGMTVVIVDPPLRLALFDRRSPDALTDDVPGVGSWLVGGHSMGGVRACQLAEDAEALVLFAAYCATDLSGTRIPVLSIAGSEDGLSTPQKIADHRGVLPEDATMGEIAGASHASFGDYGPQSGDGTAVIGDEEMDAAIEDAVAGLLGTTP
jgi:pimeloyl-ACP methyl ester carboxylesterase